MSVSGLIEKLKSSKLLKNKFVIRTLIGLLCIAALLIFASTYFGKTSSKKQIAQTTQQQVSYSCSVLDYSQKVSDQIESLLSNVGGLSNVKVVVVVESSPEIKYLVSGSGESATIVLEKQSSSSKPVVTLELAPKIKGILIVAKGTNNLILKNKVISALSATYSVDISKIDILEGK